MLRLQVDAKHINYDFILQKKYTFIRGDSGTGKTRLVTLLDAYNRGKERRIKVNCEIPIKICKDADLFLDNFDSSRECLYILDSDICNYIKCIWYDSFVKVTRNSKGTFLLLTRSDFKCIPQNLIGVYSINTINTDQKLYKTLVEVG